MVNGEKRREERDLSCWRHRCPQSTLPPAFIHLWGKGSRVVHLIKKAEGNSFIPFFTLFVSWQKYLFFSKFSNMFWYIMTQKCLFSSCKIMFLHFHESHNKGSQMWHFADFTSLYVFRHIPELCPLNIHVNLISNQHYHSHNLGQHCKVSNRDETNGQQYLYKACHYKVRLYNPEKPTGNAGRLLHPVTEVF